MADKKSKIKYDPTKTLRDYGDLAVSYSYEIDIIGSSKIKKQDVWQLNEVKSILRRQQKDGSWRYKSKKSENFSKMDYDLYETIVVLANLIEVYRLDKSHSAIKRVAEYLFSKQSTLGDIRYIYAFQYSPNYSAMVAELLIKAGYQSDPRLINILDWLMETRQQDGGWALAFRTKSYDLKSFGLDKTIEADHLKPSSVMVTGVVLRAMAIHPKYKKRREINKAAQILADGFFKADNYPDRKSKEYWIRFGYPFMYTDLISALDSLSLIGGFVDNPNVQEALDWLKGQQSKDGLFDLGTTRGNKDNQKLWLSVATYRILKRFNTPS